MTTLDLTTLPVASITEGNNVRTATDSAKFDELVASIKEHGLLQPILVGPAEGGKHPLVAGGRRYRAAKKAGLKEIPAHVADLNGGALAAAITENVVREDLDPIDEAKAVKRLREVENLKQTEVAKRLGKSERWVRERERLLRLPEGLQAMVASEAVPVAVAVPLEKIAAKAPAAAEALGKALADPDYDYIDTRTVLEEPGYALAEAARELDADVFLLQTGRYMYTLRELPDEFAEPYVERVGKLHGVGGGGWSFKLTEADLDAARAFGCLLELDEGNRGTARFLTDPAWLADRIGQKIDRDEKAAKKATKDADVAPAGDGSAEAERKAVEKREREAEAKRRQAARGANLDLGRRTYERLKRPKVTAELARAIALAAIDDNTLRAGLRTVDETYQEDTGRSVKYAKPATVLADVVDQIQRAKTPAEILGIAARVLVTGHYADPAGVPQGERSWWTPPGGAEGEAVAALAEGEGLLPPAVKKRITQARREKAAQERREEVRDELALLGHLAHGRKDDHPWNRKDLLSATGTTGGGTVADMRWGRGSKLGEALDRLIKRRQVSEKDDTLKMLAAGTKRLGAADDEHEALDREEEAMYEDDHAAA